MYTRIIVPLDGSELAEQVLPYVSLLGKGLQIPVDLLRVMEPLHYTVADPVMDWNPMAYAAGQPRAGDLPEMVANIRAHVQSYLDGISKTLRKKELQVSSNIGSSDPVKHIVEMAEKYPDALIAMSTHGLSGIKRWMVGSVTETVLLRVANPMLIVRPGDLKVISEPEIGNIIVPLDGSAIAEQALPGALALSKALNLKVVLLRIIPSSQEMYLFTGYGGYGAPMVYEKLTRDAHQDANEYLGRVARRIEGDGVPSVEKMLIHGYAPFAIAEVAQEKKDSCIAMTTHGRTGVSRWAVGSVAERVIKSSGVPVLVTRAAIK